jgi:3-hexulose-6-phosphate synthase/6-phospho-3-hexuloisomerase
MIFRAGASMVVMGQAHDASVLEQVKMAGRYGGKVVVDVVLCPDKPGCARRAQELGADHIIVHTGFDERNMFPGLSPLGDLLAVLDAVTIPVQAVDSLSVDQDCGVGRGDRCNRRAGGGERRRVQAGCF